MTFTPTDEQAAIIEFATERTENLAVIARAGAAKTSTLVLIAEALPKIDILCLAFNKKIATEMTERLPANCEAKTLHGLGYKAWWNFTRKRMVVDGRKVYSLLSNRIKSLTIQEEKDEAYSLMSETLEIISTAKQEGYLPDAFTGHWRPLIGDAEFFACLPMEPTPLQIDLVKAVCIESFRMALEGQIDFDDMILCPALCSVSWPTPTLTLVDEAQDLSPINHHILKKLVKNRRIIAVGDPCQPDGTLITKVIKRGDRWNYPKLEQVPIEDIQIGDEVLGHNANGSFMYNRKVEGITRKPYSGWLVSITGRGIHSRYTSNHHCYANFTALRDHYAVYLMKKGGCFRIGRCKMDYGDLGSGPIVRARHEDADALWVLSVWETESAAAMEEALIQAQFNIPDLTFVEGRVNGFADQTYLDQFWQEAERSLSLENNAADCLQYHRRDIEYPLWTKASQYSSLKRPMITHACNLISGVSVMPYRGEKKTGRDDWEIVDVGYEAYEGYVTSFTISDNHLYVADNVVTHNCQAIYGFRGALADSMDRLIEKFSMELRYLTISFRCARAITENVHWRAPDMQYPEWAIPGTVSRPHHWSPLDIPDGAAILCRNNAPLFSMAIKLIELGKLPELAGKDIATPLKKIMKKLGKSTMKQEPALVSLDAWESNEIKRARNGAVGGIKDRAQCIRVILNRTETLGDAMAYLDHILARDGRIHLMTGHKSKGLEFNTVFFLDSYLCKIDRDQDANIKYVIETRAQEHLIYVASNAMEGAE